MMTIKINQLIKVHWKDPALRMKIGLSELPEYSEDFLEDTISYGRVAKISKKAINLVQNENSTSMDILTIPYSIVSKIEILNK